MKVHIAISVSDISQSINQYTIFLKKPPVLVVPKEYALWRTKELNLSLRKTNDTSGKIRHLGFEDDSFSSFDTFTDRDGVLWETFNKVNQKSEIQTIWPNIKDYL